MSGHSKWSKIHRQKEVADQKRGWLFSKLSKVIAIAAREGADPEVNFKLRLAIEKAREANMPKENVERVLRQARDKLGGGKLEEVVYEGYGPGQVALMVETATDNRNRTTAEIKNLLEKRGGTLAGPGSVSFQFKKTGMVVVEKGSSPEEAMLKIIDLGVEDVEEGSDAIEVYVRPEETEELKRKLEALNLKVARMEIIRRPLVTMSVKNKTEAKKIIEFIEALEDHDDVQRVYTNLDIPDEVLEKISH